MTTLLAFLVVVFVLVIVHEYGHYLAARLAGVKVLRFSVGFGRPLFVKRLGRDQTEWTLSALPLGGYVKMLDEREGEVDAREAHRAFNRASVWRRIAIVAAGPMANFVLAVVVFWGLFIHGIPAIKPVIGEPQAGTPAAVAGLKRGDEVARIDGNAVRTFADLRLALVEAAAKRGRVEIELANGERRELDFSSLTSDYLEGDGRLLGLTPYMPALPPVIGGLEPGGVAERAGLRAGERILAVDGVAVEDWEAFAQKVRERPGQTMELRLRSGSLERSVRLTPAAVEEGGRTIGRIGVRPEVDPALFAALRTEERHAPCRRSRMP